jgi:hypothetical protein
LRFGSDKCGKINSVNSGSLNCTGMTLYSGFAESFGITFRPVEISYCDRQVTIMRGLTYFSKLATSSFVSPAVSAAPSYFIWGNSTCTHTNHGSAKKTKGRVNNLCLSLF